MNDTALDTRKDEAPVAKSRRWLRPVYKVTEATEAFRVAVELPGVGRDSVDISIEEDLLTIVGTRAQAIPEGWRPLRRELPEGDYRLELRLNVPINESKVSASVENGILDLSLPKTDEVKPRKIQVN